MRHLPNLHLLLFVLTWILAVTWGSAGILVMTGGLLVVQLVAWRADFVRLGSFRRSWSRRTTRSHPGRSHPVRSHPGPSYPMTSYEGLRHSIRLGAHSRREFDFGLRRRLERVASTRLADSHGIDPHRDPAAARELLGDPVWTLLDPQRPISTERSRGGVPEATLTKIVDTLEQL